MAAKLSKQWAALPLFARRQISVIITYGKMPFVMPEENALLFKTNGRSVSTDQSLLHLTLGIEVLILDSSQETLIPQESSKKFTTT